MNNIEIYVNKKRLEIGSDTDLSLNKSFEINGSVEFSYSFTIPSTYNNQCILGFSNKLHVINKFKNKFLTELYVNDVLIITGTLYIDSASSNNYSCNLISNQKIELSDAIKSSTNSNVDEEDIYIDEIKLNKPDKNGKYYRWILKNPSLGGDWENCWMLNKENDTTAYENLNIVDECLVYPFALYGKPINYLTGSGTEKPNTEKIQQDNNYNGKVIDANLYGLTAIKNPQQYLRPSFRVVDIFKSIFLNSGYTNFSGTFFTDRRFTDLYQTFQGSEKDYYDRDNQKFLFEITKHIESTYNHITSDGRYVDESIARDYDYSLFDWRPEEYDDEFEDERAIKFMCTKLFQPADLTINGRRLVTTAMKYNGTDWNNPIMKNYDLEKTANSFNEIVIKKAGWYHIRNTFSYLYETNTSGKTGGRYDPYYKVAKDRYLTLCSNNRGNDYVNLANNIWEFQIVKHRTDPTIYSDVLGKRNQEYLKTSPYLIPKKVDSDEFGKVEYIDTRFNSVKTPGNSNNDKFAYNIRIPKNNETLFVDSEDFICGFRIGNQGHYDYTGGTTRPINREAIGDILNLPLINKGYIDGNYVDEVYTDETKMLKLWKADKGYKVTADKAGVDSNCNYYTAMNLTAINMLRKENSYTAINTNLKPSNINNSGYYDTYEYTVNDVTYKNELGTRFVLYDNYCDNRYKSDVNIKNGNSGFKVISNNLVWLDEGEYDARLISPVIASNLKSPESSDYNEQDTNYYGVAHNKIDYDLNIEYIGISDKDWKPTANKVNEGVYSEKYTYFNQYLPHEKASEWVENLKSTFNLDISFNKDSKEVSVNFNDNSNFSNSVDITDFVDFGSLKTSGSDSSVNFKESNQPSKISIQMNNDKDEYGIETNTGNYTFNIGGTNEEEIIKTNYSYPVIENIEVGDFEVPRVIIPTPIICTDTVWKADYPFTQTYEYSGSDKARLYYKSGVVNNDKIYDTLVVFTNYDTDKRYNFPIFNVRSWDGIINLQYPSTYINSMWNFNSGVEYIEVSAYLPLFVYNNIRRNTLIKLDDSYFRIAQIDNYDIKTTKCKITLTIIN